MKDVNWIRALSPNFGCKTLRYNKRLIKDLKGAGVDAWFRFTGFKELAQQTVVDPRGECSHIFCVVVIRKVRHSVLNTSISTEVAVTLFASSAMASSVTQPSVSFFC